MDRQTRQAKLQQKLAQLQRRQWERSTQELLNQLAIDPQECKAFSPDHESVQDYLQWLKQSFPWLWSQIDWVAVPESQCLFWNNEEEKITAFANMCQIIQAEHLSQHSPNDPTIVVIWFNANTPVLELPWTVAQRTIAAIFEQDSDTWIIERQLGWCIECHHEGSLCYGQSVNRQKIN